MVDFSKLVDPSKFPNFKHNEASEGILGTGTEVPAVGGSKGAAKAPNGAAPAIGGQQGGKGGFVQPTLNE